MIFIVTGKLGAGKSLLAVQQAINYAAEGRKIAANFCLDFAEICHNPESKLSQCKPIMLPAMPTSKHLHALGRGGDFEDTAGLLVLDECAQFLNARTWNGPDREHVINWLLHARKRCWDVMLIVQHHNMLDKQVREALGEYLVVVRRLDRVRVPFMPIKFPRLHFGVVRYGLHPQDMVADRWITRGGEPMKCYKTHEIFGEREQTENIEMPSAAETKFKHQHVKPRLGEWLPHLWKIPLFVLARVVGYQLRKGKFVAS